MLAQLATAPAPENLAVIHDDRGMKDAKALLLTELRTAALTAPDEIEFTAEGIERLAELDQLSEAARLDEEAAIAAGEGPERANAQLIQMFWRKGAEWFGASQFDLAFLVPREAVRLSGKSWHGALCAVRQMTRSRCAKHIEVALPGGGVFRVPFTKAHLQAFVAKVEKQFSRWNENPNDVARTPRVTPTPVPPLAKKVKDSDRVAAASLMAHKNTSGDRYSLQFVLQDGPFLVSTNGHCLSVLRGQGGKAPQEIAELASKQKERPYPNWRGVLPDWLRVGSSIELSRAAEGRVCSEEFFRALVQIEGVMGHYGRTVAVHVANGSILVSAANHHEGHEFAQAGISEDTAALVYITLDYLLDVARQARKVGAAEIALCVEGDTSPAVFSFGDIGFTLCMPVRVR